MLLYNSQVSGNCYKVRLLLAYLRIPYDRREMDVIDRSDRADVLGDLNPVLRVPTLVLDDGRPLAESNAVLWFLADGTSYLPQEPFERAKVLQWLLFEQYSHEPNLAVSRFRVAIARTPPPPAEMQARLDGGYATLDAMEGRLRHEPFVVAGRYTIADICLYAYTHVAHEAGFDLGPYPGIRLWLDRVSGRPGQVPITAERSRGRSAGYCSVSTSASAGSPSWGPEPTPATRLSAFEPACWIFSVYLPPVLLSAVAAAFSTAW